jgi:hypothetical protein
MQTAKDERAELAHSLALLRARYDCGAVSPAIYATIKRIEKDLSGWNT